MLDRCIASAMWWIFMDVWYSNNTQNEAIWHAVRLGIAAHKVVLLGAMAVGGSWCVGYVGMSLAYSMRHLLKAHSHALNRTWTVKIVHKAQYNAMNICGILIYIWFIKVLLQILHKIYVACGKLVGCRYISGLCDYKLPIALACKWYL